MALRTLTLNVIRRKSFAFCPAALRKKLTARWTCKHHVWCVVFGKNLLRSKNSRTLRVREPFFKHALNSER